MQKSGNKWMREPASTHIFSFIVSTLTHFFLAEEFFSGEIYLQTQPRNMNYVIETPDRFCLWLVCDSVGILLNNVNCYV